LDRIITGDKGGFSMPIATINGISLAYEVTGEGDPVVWCHEFAGDSRSWDLQVTHFSRLFQNITWNYRGYPPSDVPTDPGAYSQDQLVDDLRGLLDDLGIERAYLVGLSMGGNVVLNFALTHSHRCRAIVVAGCGAGTTNREQFERDVAGVVDLLRTRGMDEFADVYARGPSRLSFLRKDPKGWRLFHDQLAQHSARGAALTQQGVQLKRPTIFALDERVRQLQVPTLLLIGDEDEPCVEPAIFLRRRIPNSGLQVVPKTGHTINLEEPAAFNAAVLSFLQLAEAGRWGSRAEVSTSLLPPDTRPTS
jgi:pimeloyl-ACP methyl ester carboxylesterase